MRLTMSTKKPTANNNDNNIIDILNIVHFILSSSKMTQFSFLLISVLTCTSQAFVARPSLVNTPTRVTPVQAFDPSQIFDAASTLLADASATSPSDYIPGTTGDISYSRYSYYTILALYGLSFPGLWSTIKRSTSAKMKSKTFVTAGEKMDGGKSLRQQAGEIMSYMKTNNYEVVEAGETIRFQGLIQRSKSQAFFLVFCTAIGMVSLALVLDIQFKDLVLPVIGTPNWFLLTLISPYAGIYYWQAGDRVDDCSVKLEANDQETENSISVRGSEEEVERMWRTMEWQEKGMVKVAGLLDKKAAE